MPITRIVVTMLWLGSIIPGTGTVFSQTTSTGSGQAYPTKPIRIIASAGGSNDFKARLIAQGISGPLGQPVIVENRPTPLIASETVAKALPDGYTLYVSGSTLWQQPLLQKVSYDPLRDFAPISWVDAEPQVLTVTPSLPVKSVNELISLAKARPGEFTYGSTGPGGPAWLAGELFKSMAGVNIVWVPYKTGPQAVTALISGEVYVAFPSAGAATPFIKSGKLRALAVTTAAPSILVPGLPTMAASGLPGYESAGTSGMLVPEKTPRTIISQLNREVVRVLILPDVKERILSTGAEVIASSPEQFAAMMKSDIAKTSKLIKDAGIKVD